MTGRLPQMVQSLPVVGGACELTTGGAEKAHHARRKTPEGRRERDGCLEVRDNR